MSGYCVEVNGGCINGQSIDVIVGVRKGTRTVTMGGRRNCEDEYSWRKYGTRFIFEVKGMRKGEQK